MFAATKAPNIIYILADDMGFADVQAFDPELGKIPTPHLDKLASEGMMFTDAHTSSSVCTPSRYSILTGRYNWRSNLQVGVIWGYSTPLISEKRLTIAGLLREQGYYTACIGKWHLGMDMPFKTKPEVLSRSPKEIDMDWHGAIKNGPVDVGFDHFWGISASLDMAPYIYIEDSHFLNADAMEKTPSYRKASPDFDREQTLSKICDKTVELLKEQSADKPFFFYVSLTSPHTPILPTPEWKGKSGLGDYGDFMMQTDAEIGKIITAVNDSEFLENTIIVVTADNGCSPMARIPDLKKLGHSPNGKFRGAKKGLYEGGHRVPFIVRWPESVEKGSVSDQAICLTDMMATCADILDVDLSANAGEDSVSFLPALSDKPIESTRTGIVHHSYQGEFAYRSGKWKLLLTQNSGDKRTVDKLYNIEKDPTESEDVLKDSPEVVALLMSQLQSDIDRGRSTEGPNVKNDTEEIILRKTTKIR